MVVATWWRGGGDSGGDGCGLGDSDSLTHSGGDDKSGGGRVVVKAMVAAEGGISKRRAVGICSGCGGLAARLARAGGLDTPD